jgi:hypothetical protein
MRAFVIEREIPGIGAMSAEEHCGAAATSNAALAKLAPRVHWQHSYVTGDKTFCIYLAEDEAAICRRSAHSPSPVMRLPHSGS